MLLPDARMQIRYFVIGLYVFPSFLCDPLSFMKDLATLRNPQSPFTFLSYLHSQNRLLPFINRGSTIPTRKEFSDYLSWAAQHVQDEGVNILFGHEVTGLSEGPQETINVRVKNLSTGAEQVFRTRKQAWSNVGTLNSLGLQVT